MNSKKERVNPRIPSYVKKNLEQMGYKPSEVLVKFHNERCIENPERYDKLLLSKKKLERSIKLLTEKLEDVNKELECINKDFEQYDIKKTDNYQEALKEVYAEIKKVRINIEQHNKYGDKVKKDKIKEICKKHEIKPKIIISELKEQSPDAVEKYVEKI